MNGCKRLKFFLNLRDRRTKCTFFHIGTLAGLLNEFERTVLGLFINRTQISFESRSEISRSTVESCERKRRRATSGTISDFSKTFEKNVKENHRLPLSASSVGEKSKRLAVEKRGLVLHPALMNGGAGRKKFATDCLPGSGP